MPDRGAQSSFCSPNKRSTACGIAGSPTTRKSKSASGRFTSPLRQRVSRALRSRYFTFSPSRQRAGAVVSLGCHK